MVILNPLFTGDDAPEVTSPEDALRYIDWRAYNLPYCGIYMIAASGLGPVKVGVSVCATKRVLTLQTGSPVRLRIYDYVWVKNIPTAKRIESEAHDILSANHKALIGEWFDVPVAKGYEAVQWAALSHGVEMHKEVPEHEDIQFYCNRLSRIYLQNVKGVDFAIDSDPKELAREQREEEQEERRRILRQKLGITG